MRDGNVSARPVILFAVVLIDCPAQPATASPTAEFAGVVTVRIHLRGYLLLQRVQSNLQGFYLTKGLFKVAVGGH
jgi:hypothetical protein